MSLLGLCPDLDAFKAEYPDKFLSEERIFKTIHRGDKIFIGTACGEPEYLVKALIRFVESHPKAFFDTEVFQVWSLGVAPYTDAKFKSNFRHNSFFVGDTTREAVNDGMADYTPIFLSNVPDVLSRGLVEVDVALIQVSPPDCHGYMSLGVSVDITKKATEKARLVIAQINSHMPRTHGDGFIHMKDVDYVIHHDEPILEFSPEADTDTAQRIGQYVSSLVQDGDTIQVGYGRIPNAIMANLFDKRHLGLHTELFTDGIADLMAAGVIDNSKKSVNHNKAVATFCMGHTSTYEYIHDNPSVEFRTIDYTNNPMVIANHDHMVAINSALEIDLTGQASAESLGQTYFSGIGGQADFMRGAVLSKGGKTILTLPSTAEEGTVSRIVPFLKEGAGVTLNRGDVHYVVTEFGIAYLHGKNIRERAMQLISIAHPKFRGELIKEAKRHLLIYKDQAFIPGKRGVYPEHLEAYRTTSKDLELKFRPVKISDEPLLKDFFYSLSDKSLYRRFMSVRKDIPHERLQDFVVIDYTKEMVILGVIEGDGMEQLVGVGQYGIDPASHTAEVAFAVRDDRQNQGIGSSLLGYLTTIAKREGLLGFTAETLVENQPMVHVFEKMGFDIERRTVEGVYELKMMFRGDS